jgi:hypothetical protein
VMPPSARSQPRRLGRRARQPGAGLARAAAAPTRPPGGASPARRRGWRLCRRWQPAPDDPQDAATA